MSYILKHLAHIFFPLYLMKESLIVYQKDLACFFFIELCPNKNINDSSTPGEL